MTDDVNLLRIIGYIYDAAADPSAFGRLSNEIAREFGCGTSLLYVVQNPKAKSTDLLLSATDNFDDWAHSSYTGYYRSRDVWGQRLLQRGRPGVLHGLEMIDASTLERSEIYADWYSKVGIDRAMAGLFPISGDVGVVTMNRSRREKEFDDEDKARLSLLVPHLQRAVHIRQRLAAAEQQNSLSFEVLERLGIGVMVVEMNARVLFANAVARRVMQMADVLTTAHSVLRARHPAQVGGLEKLIRDAALTSIGQGVNPGGFLSLRRAQGEALPVLIAPYRVPTPASAIPRGAALVMFADPESHVSVPEIAISQMLGISAAEGRLVSALVAGQTMADYADTVGISMNTAKTQMRQIFYKTGHNRQADVIRAVLANPLTKLANGDDLATVAREAAE
jgi:DNA-binding CsgD family transcriptional regulator